MNNKYVLYGNGSSANHGCEAIYRGTYELLGSGMIIQSENTEDDQKYGIGNIAELNHAMGGKPSALAKADAYFKLKIQKKYEYMDGIRYLPAIDHVRGMADTALSVGGDNYCYGYPQFYAYLNREYHKRGFKTVLWGCSVEPALIKDERVVKDLNTYDLIAARESITFDAVKETGAKIIYSPDPAFFMKSEECVLDSCFDHETVGINCSPMIINNEKTAGMVYENYKELISYILKNTQMNIALIPHVVLSKNDDRTVLKKLYEEFNKDSRISLIEDHNAPQLKYIISKCSCFIGARTHSTIAAYSTGVPTLVAGYSVKARGIAKDLFGEGRNYMIAAQDMQKPSDLTEEFIQMYSDRDRIREQLISKTAGFRSIADQAAEKVRHL